MSNIPYTLMVPVTYESGTETRTSFRRVGAVFENARKDTGETFLSIRLDFPVGVTELIAFPPKSLELEDEDQGAA